MASSAKVFTPIAYLQGVCPGGLAVAGNIAYVMDRGWPAQAEVDLPDGPEMASEPVETRGGFVFKVDLATNKVVEDGDNWPSPAVYNQATAGSDKPYLGPFVKGNDAYVVANAFREVAPDVRMSTDTRNGRLFRLQVNGSGHLVAGANLVDGVLHGPAGLAIAADGRLYVANRRATSGQPKLARLNADLGGGTAITVTPADSLREPGAIHYRQENNQDVLYIADLADDPAITRGNNPDPDKRGRIVRVAVSGNAGTATVLADDLDRPIALAERASADPGHPFELFVLCAAPRDRREIGVKNANATSGSFCLPPWATWSTPFGNIRRIKAPSTLTDQAPVADVTLFTPALHGPGGIAVLGDTLYVVTQAGAPAVPTDLGQAGVTGACHDAQPGYDPKWPWRQPPSAVLYAVELQ